MTRSAVRGGIFAILVVWASLPRSDGDASALTASGEDNPVATVREAESEEAPLLLHGDQQEPPPRPQGPQALPLVQPTANHLQLEVSQEGLAALQAITGPVAPVVVIGPYRSGKSFLLNQLIGVGCGSGFGVGHTRDTQTKGVWVWSQGVPRQDQEETQLVFMDTEGLESTRRVDTYDDRIFAFSAVVSSLLVYNLAEAVRESDVAKLSFATQLGKEFMAQGGEGAYRALQPNSMLWLIQRDFLGGKSVDEMLQEAMEEVPNPAGDPEISAVNNVRTSLSLLAGSSRAFGLPQPHLDRTKLCEMTDDQLATGYVSQRDALKKLVHRMAAPKLLGAEQMTGPQLASLVTHVVKILNTHKIPTVHNVIDSFNSEVISQCLKGYMEEMDSLKLPMEEDTMEKVHHQASTRAQDRFTKESFGKAPSDASSAESGGKASLAARLQEGIEREHQAHQVANRYESTRLCEQLERGCELELEELQKMHLPSERKFSDAAQRCQQSFEAGCVGPSRAQFSQRLHKAEERTHDQFMRDYNTHLFQGLVIASLLMIVVFRFFIKLSLLELAGWVLFLGLEGSGQLGIVGGDLYQSRIWHLLLAVWEIIVYNPLVDLERHWLVVLAVACLLYVWYHAAVVRRRKATQRLRRKNNYSTTRDLDV